MLKNFLKLSLILSFSVLALASCSPGYINRDNLGARATEFEIREHYSGRSIAFNPDGPYEATYETFYAADGTFKMVSLIEPEIIVGTWEASTQLGLPLLDLKEAQIYRVDNGRVFSQNFPSMTQVVYIQPSGNAIVDVIGGGNFTQPRPTPGFQAETRFNSLARQAGIN